GTPARHSGPGTALSRLRGFISVGRRGDPRVAQPTWAESGGFPFGPRGPTPARGRRHRRLFAEAETRLALGEGHFRYLDPIARLAYQRPRSCGPAAARVGSLHDPEIAAGSVSLEASFGGAPAHFKNAAAQEG